MKTTLLFLFAFACFGQQVNPYPRPLVPSTSPGGGPPIGPCGGDLSGTYPNCKIAAGVYINPVIYGADPTGVLDSSTACASAMAAAVTAGNPGSAIVHFPRGKFYMPEGCSVPRGVTVEGEGYGRLPGVPFTQLNTDTTAPVLTIAYPDDGQAYVQVINLEISCLTTTANGSTGMQIGNTVSMTWASYITVRDTTVTNCDTPVLVRNAFKLTFDNYNAIHNVSIGSAYLNPVDYTTTVSFINSDLTTGSAANAYAVKTANEQYDLNISNSAIETGFSGGTNTIIFLGGSVLKAVIDKNHCEGSGAICVDAQGNSGVTFSNNDIVSNSYGLFSSTAVLSLVFSGNSECCSSGVTALGSVPSGSTFSLFGNVAAGHPFLFNGVAVLDSGTVCSGAAALGTSAIASGAAATTITFSCPGLLATDNIMVDFNSSPLAVTGYTPSSSGMLGIIKWPSADTINISVVNNTSSSITPGARTVNVRAAR